MRKITALVILCTAVATPLVVAAAPASAAGAGYRVTVTCSVPPSQPERQLGRNSCLNYIPDGTQTFTAHVRDRSGNPVAGVSVRWTDSDTTDAHFRFKQNPCTTNSRGKCSAEIVDPSPVSGVTITVTATAGRSSGSGFLTFL